ncbi:MAG TPA: GDSL-type esterase/lipase family protein [Blastocatellia bacterium]|nr:GDSL-type esterase/lipase family protein [Blastocatellia bacterium]
MAVRAFRLTVLFFLLAIGWKFFSLESSSAQRAPQTRRNIGLFFDKLRTGKQVTIAYIGGSISQGVGASDANKSSYRALVNQWMRSHFPNSKINELNSAVGYTTSLYAAIRARRDVVEYKPDLVFLEFATSDVSEPEDAVKKSIEGIVRQLLAVSQPPEIVMIYAPNAEGKTAMSWHETIADYYHLPKINLQELLAANNQSITTLSKDGVHPNDEGHKVYAQHIISYLSEQEKLPASSPIKVLPMPFLSDEMTYGELKAFAEIQHGAGWKTEPTTDKYLPASLLSSDKAGTEISATFEGTVVGLTFKVGPDAGVIECLIDGKPAPEPLRQIDCYDKDAHIGTRIVAGGLPMGEHKLTIRVKGDKNSKSTGTWVRLGSFLMGGARPEKL